MSGNTYQPDPQWPSVGSRSHLTFHFRLKTQRPLRHPPELLPVAIENWLLWESLQIRIGNPYLEQDEAMAAAVESFAHQHPYIRGTVRRADGSILGQVGMEQKSLRVMRPSVLS